MSRVIVWLHRDLRLQDNPALASALEFFDSVIPVYLHVPAESHPWEPGSASRSWLHHSLESLRSSLRGLGGDLLLARGDDSYVLLRDIIRRCGATAAVWNRRYEPALMKRDETIAAQLRKDGVKVRCFDDYLLSPPGSIVKAHGQPYRVFTPFWNRLQSAYQPQRPYPPPLEIKTELEQAGLKSINQPLRSLGLLPTIPWDRDFYRVWQPGEQGAQRHLSSFLNTSLGEYQQQRDFPELDTTSRLSPHLHFGEISVRQIVRRCSTSGELPGGAAAPWIRQLAWREFSYHLLFHFPTTPQQEMNPRFAGFPWRSDQSSELACWQRGHSGIPIVDAGMRQLWSSGWMHNRVRMIVASLLSKNLGLDWRLGAAWFWDTLVDADLANNTMGWQWVAGCGADAAPYFRIFNPVLQSRRFDPQGCYIRRWVPELRSLSERDIHAPWQADSGDLARAGVTIPGDYPLPLVDLAQSRKDALQAYAGIK